MKRRSWKGQRMENAPVLIKGGLLCLQSSLLLVRRCTEELMNLGRRTEANVSRLSRAVLIYKPNNLTLVQEGIKATCYCEWLLNLLSCGKICNETQPLQLITSGCNWTWQLRNIFQGFFWNSLEFFCLCGGVLLSTHFARQAFFFSFFRNARLMLIGNKRHFIDCLVCTRHLLYFISNPDNGPTKELLFDPILQIGGF